MKKIDQLIAHYGLKKLPVEKTLYNQTYSSESSTAMIGLYCDVPESKSLFHKLTVDENWHFYGGDPFVLILLYPDGTSEEITMGPDFDNGEKIQYTVPAGVWQAGHMREGGQYSLFGCTMAPGFSESKFRGGTEKELIAQYPDRIEEIKKYACPAGQVTMPKLDKDEQH